MSDAQWMTPQCRARSLSDPYGGGQIGADQLGKFNRRYVLFSVPAQSLHSFGAAFDPFEEKKPFACVNERIFDHLGFRAIVMYEKYSLKHCIILGRPTFFPVRIGT